MLTSLSPQEAYTLKPLFPSTAPAPRFNFKEGFFLKTFSKNLIKKFSAGIKTKAVSFPFDRLTAQLFSFLSRRLSRHFKLIITGLLALALADLFILFLLPVFLPKEDVKAPSTNLRRLKKPSLSKAAAGSFVSSKNIFHRGDLPSSLAEKKRRAYNVIRPRL